MLKNTNRTWVKIDTNAIKSNFLNLSKIVDKNCKKMAIVKSNAYGHGIIEISKICEKIGADFLGVDCIEEALKIRDMGVNIPILVLGYTIPDFFKIASAKNISLTISNFDSLKKIIKENLNIKIHIKVDTGLHRQGFDKNDFQTIIDILKKNPQLKIEGLYSHLAGAESFKFKKYTEKQINELQKWQQVFKENNFNPIVHIGASAATMEESASHFDMVRFGIALYGLWPSDEIAEKYKNKIKLKPALTWQTIVSEIKKINKGESIGYDLSEKINVDSKIAVLPIGYWHGFPRHASKIAEVLIHDLKCKVLGKVSMDMIVVDVSKIKNIKQGDVATIIGTNNKKTFISADELAKKCNTINYEITTRINAEIPRIFY